MAKRHKRGSVVGLRKTTDNTRTIYYTDESKKKISFTTLCKFEKKDMKIVDKKITEEFNERKERFSKTRYDGLCKRTWRGIVMCEILSK